MTERDKADLRASHRVKGRQSIGLFSVTQSMDKIVQEISTVVEAKHDEIKSGEEGSETAWSKELVLLFIFKSFFNYS